MREMSLAIGKATKATQATLKTTQSATAQRPPPPTLMTLSTLRVFSITPTKSAIIHWSRTSLNAMALVVISNKMHGRKLNMEREGIQK